MSISDISFQVLQEFLRDDTLEMGNVLELIMTNKKQVQIQKLSKIHRYAITPPNKGNRYWITYYKEESKPRKLIRGHTEEELLDKLIDLYSLNHENLTFHQLYLEWLEYKKPLTNSMNTIKRYGQHYRKYFEPSALQNMKLSHIDTFILEKECNRIVKDFQLSGKRNL